MSRLTLTHRRSAWIGAVPMSGPAFDWDTIEYIVIHYPGHAGVPDGDPGEHADDLPGFIRRAHESAVRNKGYSYYYGVLVDWLGGTWEVRGDTYRNAANAPAAFNRVSFSIQAMIDVGDTTTEYADAAIADLVAQIRAIVGRAIPVIPHRDGVALFPDATATACCGDPLVAKIRAGVFEPTAPPSPEPEPDPEPPPPTLDRRLIGDDMRYACKLANGSFWLGNGLASTYAADGHTVRLAMTANGGWVIDAKTGRKIVDTAELSELTEAERDRWLGRPVAA